MVYYLKILKFTQGEIMGLFLSFDSQEKRRTYGGSAFIEIQFCKLPADTKLKKILAVNSIVHWQNDSIYVYVDDIDAFSQNYCRILDCGMYNNKKSGIVDIYGINYYMPIMIDRIIEKLYQEEPLDYEVFINWLNKAKGYNGFYILGI